MKRHLSLILVLAGIFAASCGGDTTSNLNSSEIKKGVKPVADAEVAVIEMEDPVYGTITLELYSNVAPKMVEQFKALAREGVYNGTAFHRINNTVIQGGDPNSKDDDPRNDGMGRSTKPNVPAEFSDLAFDTGILGAARSQDINSANSQFFIMLKREADFDTRYTIFGKVIEGMNIVMTISGVTPKTGERPDSPVRIKTVTIKPKN